MGGKISAFGEVSVALHLRSLRILPSSSNDPVRYLFQQQIKHLRVGAWGILLGNTDHDITQDRLPLAHHGIPPQPSLLLTPSTPLLNPAVQTYFPLRCNHAYRSQAQ